MALLVVLLLFPVLAIDPLELNSRVGLTTPVSADDGTGLVLHLPFDGNYNDLSGFGNNGTPKGNMRFANGAIGQGAQFDGGSFVEIPDSNSLDLSTALTFAVWLYKEDAGVGGDAVVLCKGDTNELNNNSPYALFHVGGGVYPTVRFAKNNSYTHVTSSTKTNFKEWYHLAATWDGKNVKFYINGALGDTKTWEGALPNSPRKLLIGYDPPGYTEYFKGIMDDLRIYNYVLSDSEIKSLYNMRSGPPPPPGTGAALQPGPGLNDGTDDGSAEKGKDTWVRSGYGTTDPYGYHPTLQYAALFNSPCNNTFAQAYVAFSLDGLPRENITSAKALMYTWVRFNGAGWPWSTDPQISLRRVTSDWNEMTLTWSDSPSYDLSIIDPHVVDTVGGGSSGHLYTEFQDWLSFDITDLYKGWANGSIPNYGIMFSTDTPICANGDEIILYTSDYSSDVSLRPKLVVTGTGTSTTTGTGAALVAESRTAAPNSTVQVPIRLDRASNIGSMNFVLTYNAQVIKVNKVDSGSLLSGALFTPNYKTPPEVRFGLATSEGISGSGTVAYIEFQVIGAAGSSSPLTFSELSTTDTSGKSVALTTQNGTVTVASGGNVKGDYNGDGKVTELDALAALKMSVKELPEDLVLDMDGNGKVTAEDARLILKKALGK
jgi:hypothetical protein